jgi:CheY-like chemotaxis protein
MKQKKKKVLCIDSDPAFLENQKEILEGKDLESCFFPFDNFRDAVQFVEKQVIDNGKSVHYILIDENISGKKLTDSLDKLASLKQYLKQPDIIVSTKNNDDDLRNHVMQYPFVSAFLVKPIPENYIEFLITGNSA